jgi:hypothetical protein
VQFDAQAAKRNTEKLGSVGAIAVAAHQRIENMLSFHVSERKSAMWWFHSGKFRRNEDAQQHAQIVQSR